MPISPTLIVSFLLSRSIKYLLVTLILFLSHQTYSQECSDSGCTPAPTTDSEETMQEMYVAYYGRPADVSGLEYWTNRLSSSNNLYPVLNAFGSSVEYMDNYGHLSNSELINGLYQQMFNRDADTEGLEFYTERLDSGIATLASIAKQIADGALNSDAETLENKVKIANKYTTNTQDGICGYSGCNYDWPTVKALISEVDSSSHPESLAGWYVQAFLLARGDDYVCDNCIWQNDSQSFIARFAPDDKEISYSIENMPQEVLDFLSIIEITKEVDTTLIDCMDPTPGYEEYITVVDNSSSSLTYHGEEQTYACYSKYIASSDIQLLLAMFDRYVANDIEQIRSNQEPEFLIEVNTDNYDVELNKVDIDTPGYEGIYEPSMLVYKDRGTLQCEESTGLSPVDSEQSLLNANIEVGKTACGVDHFAYISVCGGPNGDIVLHKIGQSRLPYAEELGYKSVYTLKYGEEDKGYTLTECD